MGQCDVFFRGISIGAKKIWAQTVIVCQIFKNSWDIEFWLAWQQPSKNELLWFRLTLIFVLDLPLRAARRRWHRSLRRQHWPRECQSNLKARIYSRLAFNERLDKLMDFRSPRCCTNERLIKRTLSILSSLMHAFSTNIELTLPFWMFYLCRRNLWRNGQELIFSHIAILVLQFWNNTFWIP